MTTHQTRPRRTSLVLASLLAAGAAALFAPADLPAAAPAPAPKPLFKDFMGLNGHFTSSPTFTGRWGGWFATTTT